MTIDQAYQTLYTSALLVIAVLLAVMLVRCAMSPGSRIGS